MADSQQSIGEFFNSMFAHIAQTQADNPTPTPAAGGDKPDKATSPAKPASGGGGGGRTTQAGADGANPIGDVVTGLMKEVGGSAATGAEAAGGFAKLVMALLGG